MFFNAFFFIYSHNFPVMANDHASMFYYFYLCMISISKHIHKMKKMINK